MKRKKSLDMIYKNQMVISATSGTDKDDGSSLDYRANIKKQTTAEITTQEIDMMHPPLYRYKTNLQSKSIIDNRRDIRDQNDNEIRNRVKPKYFSESRKNVEIKRQVTDGKQPLKKSDHFSYTESETELNNPLLETNERDFLRRKMLELKAQEKMKHLSSGNIKESHIKSQTINPARPINSGISKDQRKQVPLLRNEKFQLSANKNCSNPKNSKNCSNQSNNEKSAKIGKFSLKNDLIVDFSRKLNNLFKANKTKVIWVIQDLYKHLDLYTKMEEKITVLDQMLTHPKFKLFLSTKYDINFHSVENDKAQRNKTQPLNNNIDSIKKDKLEELINSIRNRVLARLDNESRRACIKKQILNDFDEFKNHIQGKR